MREGHHLYHHHHHQHPVVTVAHHEHPLQEEHSSPELGWRGPKAPSPGFGTAGERLGGRNLPTTLKLPTTQCGADFHKHLLFVSLQQPNLPTRSPTRGSVAGSRLAWLLRHRWKGSHGPGRQWTRQSVHSAGTSSGGRRPPELPWPTRPLPQAATDTSVGGSSVLARRELASRSRPIHRLGRAPTAPAASCPNCFIPRAGSESFSGQRQRRERGCSITARKRDLIKEVIKCFL